MIYLPIALEIASDRAREARHLALVAAAGHVAVGGPDLPPRGPHRARSRIAGAVRAFGDASHALSEAACTVASRIEGSVP